MEILYNIHITNFNYFFTPVGPEYKKKFARNVGIGVFLLFAFYGVWSLIDFSDPEITPRYEKYLDENNELNFNLRYDKNGMIIDDLQRIIDWCDYSDEKPDWYFEWNNQTHHIDSQNCKWAENKN